jgi:hypothetical protein
MIVLVVGATISTILAGKDVVTVTGVQVALVGGVSAVILWAIVVLLWSALRAPGEMAATATQAHSAELAAAQAKVAELEGEEDARLVAGQVELAPVLMVEDVTYMPNGNPIGITFRAGVHVQNRSTSGLRYRVQRFDARLEGHNQIQGDSGSSFPISPGDYMQGVGPRGFGPHAIGGFIDGEFVVEIRIARPFSKSTVIEQRRFTFMAQVYDDGPGGGRGVHMGHFSAEAGPEIYVRANIDDPDAAWSIVGALPAPAPTDGPMRTVAQLGPGQTSNDAFGLPPGTIPPDPYDPKKEEKVTRQQRRAAGREAKKVQSDPRDQYQDGK